MNKQLIKMGNEALDWCRTNDTKLLTGGTIIGMLTALATSNMATARVVRDFDAHPEWTIGDKIRHGVPHYIPSVIAASGSAYCAIKAENLNAGRIALLNAAIAASENSLNAIQSAMEKELPKSKVDKIKNEAHKEEFEKTAAVGDWEETGNGQFYFYEPWHGRKFKSSVNAIEKARLAVNNRILVENYASINDFYYELKINPIEAGSREGWNVQTGYLEINYDHFQWDDVNGETYPVCYLEYITKPRQDFHNPQRNTRW